MELTSLDLITIVAEPVLEDTITTELLRLGATGYTVCESRGRGTRGIRSGDVPGQGVRIEVVLSRAAGDRVLEWVRDRWFPNYAVIAWRSRVDVVRGEKYTAP